MTNAAAIKHHNTKHVTGGYHRKVCVDAERCASCLCVLYPVQASVKFAFSPDPDYRNQRQKCIKLTNQNRAKHKFRDFHGLVLHAWHHKNANSVTLPKQEENVVARRRYFNILDAFTRFKFSSA